MSILWCGGEDIDFPNGTAIVPGTGSGQFRTGYSRCTVAMTSIGTAKSTVFPGGAVTSCWLSLRGYIPALSTLSVRYAGLGFGGTNKGLFIGTDATTNTKMTLAKYDGTTHTVLATETGNSLASLTLKRYDIQLISYGASATVNVYVDGALILTFSGNTAVSGVTALDSVFLSNQQGASSFMTSSEIIVADEDPRAWPGLLTMVPTGLGTTDNWSNTAASNVNPTTINDANAAFTNSTAQDEQYNVTDPPSGVYAIKAVRLAARAMSTSGATAANLKLGVKNGATIATAPQHAMTTAFATYEDIFATDPTTGLAWALADMTALQLELLSA